MDIHLWIGYWYKYVDSVDVIMVNSIMMQL